jgi:diguanylate cyclase (GGDEF)-like protein
MRTKPADPKPLRIKAEAYLARTAPRVQPRTLRAADAPLVEPARPRPPAAAPHKPVLLAADGQSAHLLGRLLGNECHVRTISDVAGVLDAVRAAPPDLILLDAAAPVDVAVCRQLKADEAAAAIPVVMIADGADEARALKLGADECLTRPFQLDVVRARLRNQLRLKRRNELLERCANQDSLTDIANRRCFDLALDAEWRRAAREGQPLALLMVDVDCFKQFNDRYGHREGDHCLRRVAGALSRVLTRPGDLLARYGGEEFAAILPGTDLEGALWIGERLRQAVAELAIPLQHPNGASHVTISVGCASVQPQGRRAPYTLLQSADDRLYLAKHSGRNCVR